MPLYVKHTENRRTYFLIPLPKRFDGKVAYLDLTEKVKNAINRDRRNHYGPENGPEFSIEILHALEYVKYVSEYANEKNLHKFGTRTGYSFFVNHVGDDENGSGIKRRQHP